MKSLIWSSPLEVAETTFPGIAGHGASSLQVEKGLRPESANMAPSTKAFGKLVKAKDFWKAFKDYFNIGHSCVIFICMFSIFVYLLSYPAFTSYKDIIVSCQKTENVWQYTDK